MRRSNEQVALNRDLIIIAASRLFREHGTDGVGISDLMAAVGMTNGAFYTYFDSKEGLVEEACARALRDTVGQWEQLADDAGSQLVRIVDLYLSQGHIDNLGGGCAVAALAGDIARSGDGVRAVSARGIGRMVDAIAPLIPERTAQSRRRRATGIVATLVGSLIMARIADPDDAQRIIEAGREKCLAPI